MPLNKQSIAGSLFQTLARLVTAVGYGIATAIFNAVQQNPATSGYYANNAAEPYAAVFWFCAAVAALGLVFVPWLKVRTQGHTGDEGRSAEKAGSSGGEEDQVEGRRSEGDSQVVLEMGYMYSKETQQQVDERSVREQAVL